MSTLPRTQPPSTLQTTSTSGQRTTTGQHHICSTPHATRPAPNSAPFSLLTLRTASRLSTRPSIRQRPSCQSYLPRRASESSSLSRMLCARGVLLRMPCGRCGASSRRVKTFWRTSPSLTSIMLATLAVAWLHSTASSPHLAYKEFTGCCWLFLPSLLLVGKLVVLVYH